MSGGAVESKGVIPHTDEKQSLGLAVGEEFAKLLDFRHPGPMLGRWAILGCMVAGITEIAQIAQIAHH